MSAIAEQVSLLPVYGEEGTWQRTVLAKASDMRQDQTRCRAARIAGLGMGVMIIAGSIAGSVYTHHSNYPASFFLMTAGPIFGIGLIGASVFGIDSVGKAKNRLFTLLQGPEQAKDVGRILREDSLKTNAACDYSPADLESLGAIQKTTRKAMDTFYAFFRSGNAFRADPECKALVEEHDAWVESKWKQFQMDKIHPEVPKS